MDALDTLISAKRNQVIFRAIPDTPVKITRSKKNRSMVNSADFPKIPPHREALTITTNTLA
eukprot:5458265-Pyramimonas_sp.AAC.1